MQILLNSHFEEIINCLEIASPNANDDRSLINGLIQKGFKPIAFPGCVTDIDEYISWHEWRKKIAKDSTCEGFGMALRLYAIKSNILNDLNTFLGSVEFNSAVAEKFNIEIESCYFDGGIQKYLDGYEISPHPDIRKKAATFMVNINPSAKSEAMDHHTHYMELKKNYRYVEEFWAGNETIDRAWVPWEWADTVKLQTKNNSIVLFSPSNDTLHAVKANYDHLQTQRTQLYGNLWFHESKVDKNLSWQYLDLPSIKPVPANGLKKKLSDALPDGIRRAIKKVVRPNDQTGQRNV